VKAGGRNDVFRHISTTSTKRSKHKGIADSHHQASTT
jgi:hypothetical protein